MVLNYFKAMGHGPLRLRRESGFSLTETLTVIVILGIALSFVHLVLITNSSAYQDRIARAELGHDLNKIINYLTMDVRKASEITVVNADDLSKIVYIYDREGLLIGAYSITSEGQLTLTRIGPGEVDVLSDKVNAEKSSFEEQGNSLIVRLVLQEQLFRRKIEVESSTEIFMRN